MRKLGSLFSIFILLVSCNIDSLEFDKIKDLTYSPSAAIPLGSASYSVRELIEDLDDEQLEIDEDVDLFLTLLYRDNSNFSVSTDFVDFGTISNNLNHNLGLSNSPPSPIQTSIPITPVSFTFDFPESTGSDLIDSLFYTEANLQIEVNSSFDGNVDYTVTMVGTREINSNDDLTFSSNVNSNSSDIIQSSLAGHKTVLDNSSGQNQFEFVLEGQINIPVGAAARATDQLDINVTISNIDVSEIYGDFGLTEVDIQNQSIALDGFQEFSSTGLALGDPKIKLDITNEYGIPIRLDVSGLTAEDSDGNLITLSGAISDNGITIDAPTTTGTTALTQVEISKTNSNIQDLLNATPIRIDVPILGTTNPDGPPGPLINNFLIDQSKIDVMATVEIPLGLKMDGFSTSVDFDISDTDIEAAVSMSLRIVTQNQLPFDAIVNFQILDASDNILYEIPNVAILETPEVGADGRITEPKESIEDITLDQDGIDAFVNGSTIKAQLDINSYSADTDTFVKVFSDYQVSFELSFFGEFTTTIKFD